MEFSQFHFADYRWFWGLVIIPIACFLYIFFYKGVTNTDKLEKFADMHLIPHLLAGKGGTSQISVLKSVILSSVLWIFLMAAMAGPRWDFKIVQNFSQDKTLLILLDLSKSMDSDDIKPSRLIRARQEIEDILNLNDDIKIGLIGFAANAHIISPVTEDMNNIKHLLPSIGTDLVFVQGTRLSPALKTAEQILDFLPGSNKSILIISDGNIADPSAINIVSSLAQKNIITNTLGVGTEIGVQFVDDTGKFIERDGKILISKLEKNMLQDISKAGGGEYFDSDHTDNNKKAILKRINARSEFLAQEGAGHDGRQWEDRFYMFVFPVMLVVLLWFRKGFSFPIILAIILAQSPSVYGSAITDKLFLSKEQQAKKSLDEIEDYDQAAKLFDDPYKRGVVYYKAGKFKEAEKQFRSNAREEVRTNALYNLGNSLAMQDKLEEAVEVYQEALKLDPNNPKIKNNLGIVQVMIVEVPESEKEDSNKKPPPKEDGDLPGGGGGGGGDDEEDEEEDGGDKGDKKDDKDDQDNDGGDKDKNGDEGDKDDCDKDDCDKGDKGNKDDKGGKDKDSKNDKSDKGNESRTGDEVEADQWLDQIPSDHKNFLKNQFYLESQQQNNQTRPNIDPW